MNKKKTIILLVIGILVVTTMSIGVTYSYMKPKATKDSNETEIGINNCARITLKDNNSTISLTNMYPMEEEMGLQTTPYEFTISSTCEEYTGFNLYLTTLNDNEIKDKDIRYAVTDVDDNVLITDLLTNTEEVNDLTEEEIRELEQGLDNRRNKTYKVYNGVIPLNKDKVYKLHLWLDENTTNETMNESFKIKVSIKGYKYEGTLAEYLIKTKDRTLIYHDGKPDYKDMENYELEAGDLSYRFTGGNDVVNNYVCLDGTTEKDTCASENDLYRIIGLFQNEEGNYEIKLIKADATGEEQTGTDGAYMTGGFQPNSENTYKGNNYQNLKSYYWNSSKGNTSTEILHTNNNIWSTSNLNLINLNQNFYEYLLKKEPNLKIQKHSWQIGPVTHLLNNNSPESYAYELGSSRTKVGEEKCLNEGNLTKICQLEDVEYENYIGLMYVSDYAYAAKPQLWGDNLHRENKDMENIENWIYIGLYEWTISSATDLNTSYILGYTNGIERYNVWSGMVGIRPCFYISSDSKIKEGKGTKENPYQLTI